MSTMYPAGGTDPKAGETLRAMGVVAVSMLLKVTCVTLVQSESLMMIG